jgi:hypothetical protein
MPTESRILGFNHSEILEILRDYCDQTGRVRPDISHIRRPMVQDGRVKVVLRLDGVSETLEFTEKRTRRGHHHVLHEAGYSDGAPRNQVACSFYICDYKRIDFECRGATWLGHP